MLLGVQVLFFPKVDSKSLKTPTIKLCSDCFDVVIAPNLISTSQTYTVVNRFLLVYELSYLESNCSFPCFIFLIIYLNPVVILWIP